MFLEAFLNVSLDSSTKSMWNLLFNFNFAFHIDLIRVSTMTNFLQHFQRSFKWKQSLYNFIDVQQLNLKMFKRMQ